MGYKKSAKERFLDRYLNGVDDWDKYLTESISEDDTDHYEIGMKILDEQETFGNITNSDLGREMWYSNDFFINSRILSFITDAEDDLVEELKKVYIGMLGIPGFNAEAIDIDEEFEGYLIIINFDIDLQLTLISDLFSYYIYGIQLSDVNERYKQLPKMYENLLFLIDHEEMLKKAKEDKQDDVPIDFNSPRLIIASDLFVAGMSFVLGHEIGHHLLKHTESKGRNIVSKFKPTDVTFNQLHLDEFAADNFSFDLLIRGMKEKNHSTLLAPLIVILMTAIYDRTPEQPSQSHPSLRDRYLNLLNRMSEYNQEVALNLQQFINDVASWINYTLGGYWKTDWWKQ